MRELLHRNPTRTTGTTGVSPVASYTYSPAGDLLATHTYTNNTDYTTETYAYDLLGNRIATTDAHGNTIFRTYDPFGRVTAEWGATYPVRYTYDTAGRRTSLSTTRDGMTWDTTTWTYDPATGNSLSKTYADNSIVTYTYTPDNLLLRTTYASGKWKENVYDAQRRLSGVVYSSRNMYYELQLDAYGNATNVEDSAGNSWRYEYGFNSLLLAEKYVPAGWTATTNRLSRSYDSFDRSSGFIFSINDEPKDGIGYNYDDDGDLVSIAATNAAGRSFAVAYTNVAGYNCGYTITTPNGDTIRRIVDRDDCRRSLVTNCATYFNSSPVDSNAYAFDALSRPVSRTTGTTGILPVASTFVYNDRSEVLSAAIGTNLFTHAYDDIGNHLLFGDNATTNTFTHNQVNQMVGRAVLNAPPTTTFTYTPDGGLSSDGTWTYAYGVEDQLTSVTSSSLTNGAIRVSNTYDYRRRRTSKTVQRLHITSVPPPAPPSEEVWKTVEKRTFVYDDWNLIHETISAIDGGTTNVTEVQYFWGLDLSDSLQGVGGVGGLLAVSRNGQFYFPAYDNNGNITKYIDESGNIVATYEYDDFGRTISQSGPLADFFRHRFSTKYYDSATGLYFYGYRFYSPRWYVWLNRDQIEEKGGMNLYAMCGNNSITYLDAFGNARMLTGALLALKDTNRLKYPGYDVARSIIRLVDELNSKKGFDAKICDFVTTPLSEIKKEVDSNPNHTYFIAHGGISVNGKPFRGSAYYWHNNQSAEEMIYPKGNGDKGISLSALGDKLNRSNVFGCFLSVRVSKIKEGPWYDRRIVSSKDDYREMYKALLSRLSRYKGMNNVGCIKIRIYEGENNNEALVKQVESAKALQNSPVKGEDAYL